MECLNSRDAHFRLLLAHTSVPPKNQRFSVGSIAQLHTLKDFLQMTSKVLTITAACVFVLAGCGGSSSSDSTSSQIDPNAGAGEGQDVPTVLTGVFVDSAVEGVSYSTATQSGVTNSSGEFSYLQGEDVSFSIGSLVFPSMLAAEQLSPVDMALSSSDPIATTTNIARLLQSLDQDGNPENGITISTEATVSAPSLDFDVSTAEFEGNAEVINLVANSGSVTTSLISAQAANAHLNNTLGTTTDASIDGLYIRNPASQTESGLDDYSLVDGLNITRYNSTQASDGSLCYTVSSNTAIVVGDNSFQLNTDNGPVFYTAVRVGETLEVTFEGESTLVYPLATGVDLDSLSLCDVEDNDASSNVITEGRVTTLEQFTATLVGKTSVLRNDDGSRDESTRLFTGSDMTTTGTFRGEDTNLVWYWENGLYCRSGESGIVVVELECQVVTVSGGIVTFTSNTDASSSNSYFIEG